MSQPAAIVGKPWEILTVRLTLWILLFGAVAFGVIILIFGISNLVSQLTSGHTTLTLVANKSLPAGSPGTIRILEGSYATANVTVVGASASIVVFAMIAAIARMLIAVALCGLLASLAWRLLHGGVFRKSLTVAMTAAGAVLLIGGMVAQLGETVASGNAALELNQSAHNNFWPLAGILDLNYVGVGLVLLVTGIAFEYGQRIQRDSDGLV